MEEIEVLYGEEGLRRLDPTGKEHGFLARIQRSAFHWHEEDKYLKRHVEDIRAGRFVIMALGAASGVVVPNLIAGLVSR